MGTVSDRANGQGRLTVSLGNDRSEIVSQLNFTFFRAFGASVMFLAFATAALTANAQNVDQIAEQIKSGTTEQKRDALFQIRNLRSEIAIAARLALPALNDPEPVIRATAAASVVFLPKQEAVTALAPLLADDDAFVRKETAYALGSIGSSHATAPLLDLLRREKDVEVRSAAAVALGQTGDPSAIDPLLAILARKPVEDQEFLRRSAARSIGQIAQAINSADASVVTPQSFLPEQFKTVAGADVTARFPIFSRAVVALGSVLQNKSEADDTRREAAFALGAIGHPGSVSVLESHRNSPDPYLAEISREALLKLARTKLK